MNIVIILFGMLIAALSLYIIIRPQAALNLFETYADNAGLYWVAILVRLGMGIVLWQVADNSRYPQAFEVLGGILIVAALILLVIRQANFERIIHWVVGQFGSSARIWALFGLALGAFLIHGVTG